jgi:hypothetical protein
MSNSGYHQTPFAAIFSEFEKLREANVLMFRRLRPEDWKREGIANENRTSARGLAYVMAGHMQHHLGVLRERYLS